MTRDLYHRAGLCSRIRVRALVLLADVHVYVHVRGYACKYTRGTDATTSIRIDRQH